MAEAPTRSLVQTPGYVILLPDTMQRASVLAGKILAMSDNVHPYVFEHAPIRVQAVRLTHAWQAMHASHDLAKPVEPVLGECAAATALLATTIKFNGRISVQLQSKGPLRLMLCQATHDLGLRGMVQLGKNQTLPGDLQPGAITGLADGGQLAVTIENLRDDQRYQGITPLESPRLAQCFEHYFMQSEQLPTRLWLAANATTAAGFMLQRMPGETTTTGIARCTWPIH